MTVSSRDIVAKIAEAVCETEMRQFDRGDKAALLRAIFECAKTGIPLPPRCAKAFMRAMTETISGPGPHRSWDDVFGKPHGKHTKIHAKVQEENWRWRVYFAVLSEQSGPSREKLIRARRQGPAAVQRLIEQQKKQKPRKVSLDRAFDRVHDRFRRFGITRSLCQKYYYSARKAKNKPRGKTLATIAVTATGDVVTNFAE
jgi:hypothetical protein